MPSPTVWSQPIPETTKRHVRSQFPTLPAPRGEEKRGNQVKVGKIASCNGLPLFFLPKPVSGGKPQYGKNSETGMPVVTAYGMISCPCPIIGVQPLFFLGKNVLVFLNCEFTF